MSNTQPEGSAESSYKKGTRGPWKFNGRSQSGKNNFNIVGTVPGGKYKVARVPFEVTDSDILNEIYLEEAEADARLIAQAPQLLKERTELLEALREIADKTRLIDFSSSISEHFKCKREVFEIAQQVLTKLNQK